MFYFYKPIMKRQLPTFPKSTRYFFLLSFGYTFIVLFTTIVNFLSYMKVGPLLDNEYLDLVYFEYFFSTLAAQMYYYMIFWIIVFCLSFICNELYLWKKKAFVKKNCLYSFIWLLICSSLLIAGHLLLWNGGQESIALYLYSALSL